VIVLFYRGARNPWRPNLPIQTLYPQTLYHISLILSNHRKKVWALYISNLGLSSILYLKYAQKASDFFEKDLNLFIKP
jgi:hypothetical protein